MDFYPMLLDHDAANACCLRLFPAWIYTHKWRW